MKIVLRIILLLFLTFQFVCSQHLEDKIKIFKTDLYEIHYPSYLDKRELKHTQKIMDFTIQRYKKLIGEDPSYLAILLFCTPEEMQAFNFKDLILRNVCFLPFFAGDTPEKLFKKIKIRTLDGLGLIITQTELGPIIVSGMIPFGSSDKSNFVKEDRIEKMNEKQYRNIDTLISDFKELNEKDEINFILKRDSQLISVKIIKPEESMFSFTSQEVGKKEKSLKEIEKEFEILSHEIGHRFLINYFDKKYGKSYVLGQSVGTQPHYGHSEIPDWFDEAFAMMFENKKLKEQRWKYIKSGKCKFIPLKNLFNINKLETIQDSSQEDKKNMVSLPLKGMNDTTYSDTSQINKISSVQFDSILKKKESKITVNVKIRFTEEDDDVSLYDDEEIFSFMEYLIEKEGEEIVQKFIKGFYEKKSSLEILLEEAKTIPHHIPEIESDWQGWIGQK